MPTPDQLTNPEIAHGTFANKAWDSPGGMEIGPAYKTGVQPTTTTGTPRQFLPGNITKDQIAPQRPDDWGFPDSPTMGSNIPGRPDVSTGIYAQPQPSHYTGENLTRELQATPAPGAATQAYTQPTAQAGTTAGQPSAQINPTAITPNNQSFGEDTEQFMIPGFLEPYPFEQDTQQSADFRQRYGDWLGQQESPEATRQRFENRYGYQPLREEYFRGQEMMGDLSSAIRGRPDQVLGRSRETVMTQGQIDKITSDEVGELMKSYTDLGQIQGLRAQQLADVERNMNDAAQLELARQQQMSQPWLMEYDTDAIHQARKFSGWTYANDLELSRLLANQMTGKAWSTEEADRANQLAIAEMGFKNALDQIRLQGEQNRMTQNAPRSSSLADLYKSMMT